MVPDPQTFDYILPSTQIASTHAIPRDHSRLMVISRHDSSIVPDFHFYDLKSLLQSGDVLILNQTKVFPARLFGQKSSLGQVEVLLLEQLSLDTWRCISKPGLKIGQIVNFPRDLSCTVISRNIATGEAEIKFNHSGSQLLNLIDDIGITPLPHYIQNHQDEQQLRRIYQTVYAKQSGSAAAPTAGLHFTPQLLDELSQKGIAVEKITLHVGLGTFQPLRPKHLATGKLHTEKYFIDPDTSARLVQYKKQHRRFVAVGTTTARTLESNPDFSPGWHSTDIFIYPPYQFKVVDALITNFHLPQSSLLMMIAAFASHPNSSQKFTSFGDSLISRAYQIAIDHDFKFFSFGDAMLIC